MSPHPDLARFFSLNSEWAKHVQSQEPQFFAKSATGQSPTILWIGCSDSRVPESVVTAVLLLLPYRAVSAHIRGEPPRRETRCFLSFSLFITAIPTVLVVSLPRFAVVIVGHSECGGAAACFGAACSPKFNPSAEICVVDPGLEHDAPLNQWLTPLTKLAAGLKLSSVPKAEALPVIVDENVKRQVQNLCMAQTIVDAWTDDKKVWIHGWVYDLAKGQLRDLNVSRGPPE
ncbi:Carbonic anhydrase [Mycena sanguinolenta]|uniref:Carbonic anhydrase n=1 Tax=Mycena sanguinolenta TaxID=230812 RepID=A0A8H6YP59_9AGAR|nr:Carbonic anhydrase [Mycena sanguinolenta]